MTKRKIYFPLFIGLAVAIGIFIGSTLNFDKKATLFSNNSSEVKIKKLINYIEYDYVDEVDTNSLLDDAITNMLVKLDPHSVYIPKEDLQQETENMQGKFVGIGVSFLMHQDSVTVSGVIKNGPSEKAGIKAGDRIIAANKDSLFGEILIKKAGLTKSEIGSRLGDRKITNAVMKALKGAPKTEVLVTVYRRQTNEVLNIPISRGIVPIASIKGHYMVNSTLGYINIDRFARTTYKEFKISLDELIAKGMNSLILDLRGNPGGFMDIANKIIDEFLEDGKLIVYTKNKSGQENDYFATRKGDFENGNVYVLIDQNSASASEIVAGALQDNDKGTIVGRRSFGKGLVQQEMDLGDGSAVRLTTSRYYTPTGRSIQKPYSSKNMSKYNGDYLARVRSGELLSRDSIKVVDSLKFTTPKGKVVYGGGGIIPDVFVPIDTSNSYSTKLYGRLNQFIFDYVDNHRKDFNNLELEEFVQNFDNDEAIFNKYVNELDLKFPIGPKSKENLQLYFKAIFARNVFDETGFLMITQQKDNMILKVLELEENRE